MATNWLNQSGPDAANIYGNEAVRQWMERNGYSVGQYGDMTKAPGNVSQDTPSGPEQDYMGIAKFLAEKGLTPQLAQDAGIDYWRLVDSVGNEMVRGQYDTNDAGWFEKAVPLAIAAMGAGAAGYGAGLLGGESAALGANQVGAMNAGGIGVDAALSGVAPTAAELSAITPTIGTAGGIGVGSLETSLGGVLGYEAALPGMGAAGTTVGGAVVPAGGSFWGSLGKAAIGPAISAGATLIGSNMAGKSLADATGKANELQRYMYDTTRADNMPALNARNNALTQIQSLLADPSSLTKDPGYAFGLNQGQKTLANGAAARGMTYSGAQGKALQRYGQDYAGTKLDQSVNRLTSLANVGQAGASTIAGAGQNYAGQVGNNLTALGDAKASQYMVNSNALGNAVNGLTAYGQKQGWWGTPG